MLRIICACFIIVCSSGNILSQVSPEEYFGDSYQEALDFCRINRNHFVQMQNDYNINPSIACAIIFPELIRYSRFRDFMETSALEIAYVSGGATMVDFSIGQFQMKPSFVEMIENELKIIGNDKLAFNEITYYPSTFSVQDIRRERLTRLKSQHWQQIYLACFIMLAKYRFENEIINNPSEELLILSSAYNLGLRANYFDLLRVAELKTFPYGRILGGRYSYYDVSYYFYTNHSHLIQTNL